MIKEEGVDISEQAPSQRRQKEVQCSANCSFESTGFEYPHFYPNPFLPYPPLLPWGYSNAYFPCEFPLQPTQHYSPPSCPQPTPPKLQNKIKEEEIRIKAPATRSAEDSPLKLKIEEKEGSQGDLEYVPPEYMSELTKRGSKKKKQKYTSYYWGLEENRRYMDFLESHPGLFDLSINAKKNLRVNVMMSRKVRSRSPQQCHSHHQKMIKKHGSIQQVIQFLRSVRTKAALRGQPQDQVKVEEVAEGKLQLT